MLRNLLLEARSEGAADADEYEPDMYRVDSASMTAGNTTFQPPQAASTTSQTNWQWQDHQARYAHEANVVLRRWGQAGGQEWGLARGAGGGAGGGAIVVLRG